MKTPFWFSNIYVLALKDEEKDPIEAPPGPYKLQPENQET